MLPQALSKANPLCKLGAPWGSWRRWSRSARTSGLTVTAQGAKLVRAELFPNISVGDAPLVNDAKAGKTLKIRALSDDQLSSMGAKLAKHLVAVMKEAGIAEDTDLLAWVESDESRAAAYTFGALQALKAAAGVKDIKLEV